MKYPFRLFVFALVVTARCYAADVITLTGSTSYVVPANSVAEIVSVTDARGVEPTFYLNNNVSVATAKGSSGTEVVSLLPIVVGSGSTISKRAPGSSGSDGFLTLRVRTKSEYFASLAGGNSGGSGSTNSVHITVATPITSTAVVIPQDATGPVTVALESSADLITWTAAAPGTYGSSSSNRFFRVRTIRNPD